MQALGACAFGVLGVCFGGLGFLRRRVQGLGFQGLECSGLGFRVGGLGLRAVALPRHRVPKGPIQKPNH